MSFKCIDCILISVSFSTNDIFIFDNEKLLSTFDYATEIVTQLHNHFPILACKFCFKMQYISNFKLTMVNSSTFHKQCVHNNFFILEQICSRNKNCSKQISKYYKRNLYICTKIEQQEIMISIGYHSLTDN
jgi:hypothetical protein